MAAMLQWPCSLRSQPGLPMKKGRAGTMTHDYKRHGTTTLFAALNVLTGVVIGNCMPRHSRREFLRFLKQIDKETPADLDLHLILDNYATHKTAEVRRWLAAHPSFHLHFTPTSASWFNLVERFFTEITEKRIRRGAFDSVAALETAIMAYLEQHNAKPKPFVWSASARSILEKVARAKQALISILAGAVAIKLRPTWACDRRMHADGVCKNKTHERLIVPEITAGETPRLFPQTVEPAQLPLVYPLWIVKFLLNILI
jgi:transposase